VQRGKLRVRAADEVEELDEGDSAHYPADVPHSLENAGDDDVVVFLVVTYP
jgi:quercetin dioxygenase-like cupin family protein